MEKTRETRPSKAPKQPSDIQFKPLSEGLGFHPFADGLPYAPVSPGQQPTVPRPNLSGGTGAVAGGRPQFAFPRPTAPTAPRVSVPTATPIAVMEKPRDVRTAPVETALPLQENFGLGYVFRRAFAYGIDSTLNIGVCAALLWTVLWRQGFRVESLFNPSVAIVAGLFLAVFNWALITAQEVAVGTSIGKRLMGLRIPGGATAVFLRAFFFVPSLGFAGIGLLWSVFDRNKRCWHDLIVNTQPVNFTRL